MLNDELIGVTFLLFKDFISSVHSTGILLYAFHVVAHNELRKYLTDFMFPLKRVFCGVLEIR